MKRIICIAMVCVIMLTLFVTASAEKVVTLKLDGKKVVCDVPPCIVENRTLIPARALFEELGAEVSWNEKKRVVTIDYDGTEIVLPIDSTKVTVGGEKKELDVPAMIVKDRTMIPVRFVAEHFGFTVEWNESTYTVNVVPAYKYTYKYTVKDAKITSSKDETVIAIPGTAGAKVKVMTLAEPTRLVFDFSDTRMEIAKSNFTVDDEFLDSVRFGQFDRTTMRIVLDVKDDADFELFHDDDGKNYKIALRSEGYVPEDETDEEEEEETFDIGDKVVFIDPGHGGSDVGTIGTLYTSDSDLLGRIEDAKVEKTIYEKEINLKISLKVNKLLKEAGVKTYILREIDKAVDIYERPKIANNKNAYLYLSIHNNASTSATVHGTQVYYADSMPSYENMTNKKLAEIYYKKITEATGLRQAGMVDNPRYIVLNQTKMPSLILEVGFCSNQSDLRKLIDDKFLDKVAKSICNATLEVLKKAGDIKEVKKTTE